jgi:hypothetical protein
MTAFDPHPAERNGPPTQGRPDRPSWWWSLAGLRRRPRRRIRLLPNRWGWALLLMLAFIIGGAVFAEYSMQPEFCRTCHIMEPYCQAWHESTHDGIPCGDCHFEPGWESTIRGKFQASSQALKYITNTCGSRPHAEVPSIRGQTYLAAQPACDHCHGERYGDLLDAWKMTVDEHLSRTEAACARARDAIDALEGDAVELLRPRRLLADAEHDVRFVRFGRGVHNINYATALFNVVIENCREIEQTGRKSGAPP